MNIKYLLAIIIASLYHYIGLSQFNYKIDHSLNPNLEYPVFSQQLYTSFSKIETIKVLAVMVEFVEDNDDRTSGNGKFDLSPPDSIIDSPPHDKSYFDNHLRFLKNYWSKSTNGKLIVDYYLLDRVFTLPNQMKYYSPPKKSINFAEIGYLIEDTWKTVDSLYQDFPFEKYDAFIIFHAGVGRDVDLTSIYGYDPTPYDIPTLYMNLNSLKRIFGPDYPGVRVKSGNFFIKNSLIIPETENRKISTVGGSTLLQLSINGILAGTFGSYLGLPDLFNTKTGRTAIGRFGLMDGQSMFSWNGLFPPEPSAWEKYFLEKKYNLGSIKIIEIDSSAIINLPAVGLSGTDTIYKVNLNSKEYFLIENRNRDANRDGANLTLVYNGVTIQKNFQYDTDNFNYLNQRAIFGVLTDIDEPDWSLPGGITKDGRFFDGGVLIWHIDENVIENNFATNTINNDPKRRGVDLEEADGSQDIGQSYGFLSPGSGSEDGTSLDFWFNGNSAPVYKNEFSQKTFPNTLSNDFAKSHITIKNFSSRSPRMTAEVSIGSDLIKPVAGFPKSLPSPIPQPPQIVGNRIFISTGDSIFSFLTDGRSATQNNDGLFYSKGGKFPLSTIESNRFIILSDSSLVILSAHDINNDLVYDTIYPEYEYKANRIITTPPIVKTTFSLTVPLIIYFGDEAGNLHIIKETFSGYTSESSKISNHSIADITYNNKGLFVASGDSIKNLNGNLNFKLPRFSSNWILASADKNLYQNNFIVAAEKIGNYLYILDLDNQQSKEVKFFGSGINDLAISDLDNNGSRDIIISAGNRLFGFNYTGATLDNFPIELPDSASSPPLIADLNGDNLLDVIIACKNNLIAAYSADGKALSDFPFSSSTGSSSYLCIAKNNLIPGSTLSLVSSEGHLYTYQLPEASAVLWGQYKREILHSSFDNSILSGKQIDEFFPPSRAYNWPNPVYGDETNIRFYVSENSHVTIKIFDVSGKLVDELSTNAIGGYDNEVIWKVANIQSGIYYAHIKAQSSSNENSTLIKIAVIK